MTQLRKPGILFWIIGIFSLLWYLLGVSRYLLYTLKPDSFISKLPADELEYMNNIPAWAMAAFAIAVFIGLIACILLLMRKKLAISFFVISLVAVIVQQSYIFFVQSNIELTGDKVIIPLFVLIIAGFLMWYSKGLYAKDIIN